MPTNDQKEALSKFLKEKMRQLGSDTIKEFSVRIGVPRRTLSGWFSGQKWPSTKYHNLLIELGLDKNFFGGENPLFEVSASETKPNQPEDDTNREAERYSSRSESVRSPQASGRTNASEKWGSSLVPDTALGKVPLFILGSGVSSGQVPFLRDIAQLLGHHLDHDPSNSELVKLRLLAHKVGQRNKEDTSVSRSHVSQLFSAAMRFPEARAAWREFSADLLHRGNEEGELNVKPMLHAKFTDAHEVLADLLIERKAICLSLNFDRLTWKALKDKDDRGVVLHNDFEINRYYTALDQDYVPPVIKIRGDVLSVKCENLSCPWSAGSRPVPDKEQLDLNGDRLLCPECGTGDLVAELSFPGEQRKEEEAMRALSALQSHIAGTVSSIVFVGLSGEWDTHVVHWACEYSKEYAVPILHNKKGQKESLIEAYRRRHYPDLRPIDVIVQTKDEFLREFADYATRIRKRTKPGFKWEACRRDVPGALAPVYLQDAELWLTGSIARDGKAPISLSESDFEDVQLQSSLQDYLDGMAQLSLIDGFVGRKKPHTRWDHSRGSMNIGSLWIKSLQESLEKTRPTDFKNLNAISVLYKYALLVHDCGHLPFSHLLERVLLRINWVPGDSRDLQMDVLRERLHETKGSNLNIGIDCEYLSRGIQTFSDLPSGSVQFLQKYTVELLLRIVQGKGPWPWTNVVLNSPIDADKIDYLTRDRFEFARKGLDGYVSGRLGQRASGNKPSMSWVEDFFAGQVVTPSGAIALEKRSAVAAADLWRQRQLMYRRFYIAPEFRVYERIAMEFVEQYLIRYVMGAHEEWDNKGSPGRSRPYNSFRSDNSTPLPWDLRPKKALQVRRHLERLIEGRDRGRLREWDTLHKFIIPAVTDRSKTFIAYDEKYKEFLHRLHGVLLDIKNEDSWPYEALKYIVGEPIRIRHSNDVEVVEALRPLQHLYGTCVLIDVVSTPRALSGPPTVSMRNGTRIFGNILVPEGRAETWTTAHKTGVPLTDEAVAGMEDDSVQVLVISPEKNTSPEALWAYESIRARCVSLAEN